MVSRFIFSLVLLAFAFLTGCKNLERDNPLDPENEKSLTYSAVLVEAFVNTAHPSPYNRWALESLRNLQEKYYADFIVCEYHRDLQVDTTVYDDPYNTPDNQTVFQLLQDRYVSQHNDVPRGVPDVYLNGAQYRFSGTYNAQSLRQQVEPLFLQQISQENYFALQPEITFINDTTLQVKCLVAGLGMHVVEQKRLRVIFLKKEWDKAWGLHLNVVTKLVWPGIPVPDIKKGAYKTVDAGRFHFKDLPDRVVVALVSDDELTVYQTRYTDVGKQ